MSRGKLHCIVAVVAVAGFFAVAPPRAEAAGGAPSGPDFWSVALHWVESWWEGLTWNIQEYEGGMIDPNGGQGVPPSASEEWWPLGPNR